MQVNQHWDICSTSFLNLTILWYVHRHLCMGVLAPPPFPPVRNTHEFLGTGSLYIKELWLFLFLLTITYWINSVYSNYIKPQVFPKGSLKKQLLIFGHCPKDSNPLPTAQPLLIGTYKVWTFWDTLEPPPHPPPPNLYNI